MRLLISGGSALPDDVHKAFRGLGFNLYEGYGLTEAAPVLTVNRAGQQAAAPGTVGEPLPGHRACRSTSPTRAASAR